MTESRQISENISRENRMNEMLGTTIASSSFLGVFLGYEKFSELFSIPQNNIGNLDSCQFLESCECERQCLCNRFQHDEYGAY
jgi:hypothetical protein